VCQAASASSGSFFHHFGSKEGLKGSLFVEALRADRARLLPAARLIFEQHRAEWLGLYRDEPAAEIADFARRFDAWRAPWVDSDLTLTAPSDTPS
jgi:AcrR family transcriptional regulator